MAGNENGQLVVLAGPAGVGKSTVVSRLRAEVPGLYFSVSMTTRAARPGEVDGRDYFFVTPEKFQQHIDAGEMLEWAEIHGGLQRSGTPRGPVDKALAEGRPVLVEVDLAGARSIRKVAPNAHLLFLAPPSWEILVSRLTGRGTETEAQVKRRLETARVEMDAQHEFDEVVVNDNVDDAVAAIARALTTGK
ncbi:MULTISPECIES: guanylate kinase [Corynebacterium]|uniref:Guanylate kinase n=1 Tax=Corynebacterium amycolatum TaxID=43765 RepID=A0A1V2CAV4_CORAY|nr:MULTISPECIES: guanylate kinase [Corynebacterium]MBC6758058.1 guanylate kinase [Corynebacterium sp. LK24]MBC6761547.1 guanylate kinase [Corynebacterium sp. LK27]MBC6822819.1 guanylate kinase [Corynebacterium sp. LK33]MCQ9349904.1 guanylate kinase [Corynebacterium sp. 5QC2CO]EPD47342.1 guanylate kinase [Corynebacterium sp. HFH0082]